MPDLLTAPLSMPEIFVRVRPVEIGEHSYVGEFSHLSQHTTIGKFCSIGNLCTIGAQKHVTDELTTSPKVQGHDWTPPIQATYIGNDVWIGSNSVIMAGVRVNDGAIIGAGAVVTKEVPPYAVVAGVPARTLRYRLPIEQIAALIELKWWNLPIEAIRMLPFKDVAKCIAVLKAMTILQDEGTLGTVIERVAA